MRLSGPEGSSPAPTTFLVLAKCGSYRRPELRTASVDAKMAAKGVKMMILRILGLAVVASLLTTSLLATSLLTTSAHATKGKCRSYVKMPVSVALSTGRAFAVANSRFTSGQNRLRGELGPHQYVYLPVWSRDCRLRVIAHRRGRTNKR